jgi:checkpoint serine/threonine-protein kinase
VPELVVAHYAAEMVRFVRAVHSSSILHCDIKPDNWLLTHRSSSSSSSSSSAAAASTTAATVAATDSSSTGSGSSKEPPALEANTVSLIDFGRAIDLRNYPNSGREASFVCSAACAAKGFGCPQMAAGTPWRFELDLCGLASTIHFLLHSEPLELVTAAATTGAAAAGASSGDGQQQQQQRWRPAKRCKRYWNVTMWDSVFDALLNHSSSSSNSGSSSSSGSSNSSAEVLMQCEAALLAYTRGDASRSRDLQQLLRQQWNLIFRL